MPGLGLVVVGVDSPWGFSFRPLSTLDLDDLGILAGSIFGGWYLPLGGGEESCWLPERLSKRDLLSPQTELLGRGRVVVGAVREAQLGS